MPMKPARCDGKYVSLPVIAHIQCSLSKECHNTRCFFWQRDNAGLPPFWYPDGHTEKWQEVKAKHGETSYPEFSADVGTNCISVSCMDYTWEDGKTYRDLSKENGREV